VETVMVLGGNAGNVGQLVSKEQTWWETDGKHVDDSSYLLESW